MNRFSKKGNQQLEIASENINLLDTRQAEMFEERIALLRELADVALSNTGDELSQLERIREAYLSALPQPVDARDLSEFCEPTVIKEFFGTMTVVEKLELCRFIAQKSASVDLTRLLLYANGTSQPESVLPTARGRIAYMKNNFTESAFISFSRIVSNPRSAYFQSFDAVCEEVYSGECEFCILPIESSLEGRLNSFYSMIDRYELKISAVCIVEQHDSQRFTKFALLKKSLSDSLLKQSKNSEQILEFKISSAIGASEASPVCDIIVAAGAFGMRLLRIDSMPLPYNDEMMSFYISLSADKAQLIPFLLYLTLEFPQYDPLGLYFNAN